MTGDEVNFGQFCLDLRHRQLSFNGKPVPLAGRALDILCVLAAAKGDVVSKDQLMEKVWSGQVVEENNIQVHVSALRKEIDQKANGDSFVVTVPGRGYRLMGLAPASAAKKTDDYDEDRPAALGTSIAVLPFANISGDPEQDYFADGIVEDIITGFSRVKWLFVIARNSSFVYKGRSVDVKQVGRDLGVRYILEGSVRRAGNRVRITAQLVEAQTGVHLWAERYDRLVDDIFAVQDEITMSVIGAIEPNLRRAEIERVKRKRPDNLDAYDLVLRALPFVHKRMMDGANAAIPLLQKALALEPDYAAAHAFLAQSFHFRFSRGGLHEADRKLSIAHAHAAIAGGTDDATTLAIAGIVVWFDEHDVATALDCFDRALAISNSNIVALGNSAFVLAWMGRTDLAIERAMRAIELSPLDTVNAHLALSVANFQAGNYDAARDAARRAAEFNPSFSVPRALLAAALVRLGRLEEAKSEAKRTLDRDPNFTTKTWSVTVGVAPKVYSPIADALHDAGIPDH